MIEPKYSVLQSLFADRVFRIPHYQRFYSWQPQQRGDLFSDLRNLASQNQDQHHFMATIVCYRTPKTTTVGAAKYRVYDLVDGQQRLTTLIILLKCVELAMPSNSEVRIELASILVKRDGHLILLQTNNANERIFNRFIRMGTVPTEKDIETYSDANLAAAISDCQSFVDEWIERGPLQDLLSLVLHRLGFVVHDTEDSRAVYTLFEVLNSRGLAVDWLDKCKSIVMGRSVDLAQSPEASDAELLTLQHLWGQIYLELAREDVPGEEVLRVAATLHYGTGAAKPLSAEESLGVIRSKCDAFDKPREVSERLFQIARHLSAVRGNIFLGPTTDILHARILAIALSSATSLNDEERHSLLDQWERVTFRIFGLYGKDARTKVGDYVRLATQIVANESGVRTYDQIKSRLRSLGMEYPIKTAVLEGLSNKDCYDESPERCRYVLWKYEEHLAGKLGKGATIDANERAAIWKLRAVDSIEHVFPQTFWSVEEWEGKIAGNGQYNNPAHIGRIGNLVLLPIRLNQAASAKPFVQKKVEYAKHNLRMIHEVCAESDWTLAQIEAREARILAWAETQWCDLP